MNSKTPNQPARITSEVKHDIGFVVLCPELNVSGVKTTFASIRNNSYNRDTICVVGSNAAAKDIKELKEICPTHKGDETLTSLINLGIKKTKHDWAFLMFAGSRIRPYLERKLEAVCDEENEVIFPVVDRIWSFVEGSFNGVMINTKFFEQVGEFPSVTLNKENINDFEFSKLMWSMNALKQGAKLKAIVGMRIG